MKLPFGASCSIFSNSTAFPDQSIVEMTFGGVPSMLLDENVRILHCCACIESERCVAAQKVDSALKSPTKTKGAVLVSA